MTTDLFAAFLIGIAGSVHCVSMCGGVMAGLTYAIPKDRNPSLYLAGYNVGRISSYTIAGSLTGAFGNLVTSSVEQGIGWLNLLSGIFLLLLAGYIGNWWLFLRNLESIGASLFKRIQPYSKSLIPFPTAFHALPYGIIWGWLPCGLVYSTLSWSLASGSAMKGGLLMLCFGLGTLPSLLAVSASSKEIVNIFKSPKTKQVVAISLLILGIYNISQALKVIL